MSLVAMHWCCCGLHHHLRHPSLVKAHLSSIFASYVFPPFNPHPAAALKSLIWWWMPFDGKYRRQHSRRLVTLNVRRCYAVLSIALKIIWYNTIMRLRPPTRHVHFGHADNVAFKAQINSESLCFRWIVFIAAERGFVCGTQFMMCLWWWWHRTII